jgi:hypothetical protein
LKDSNVAVIMLTTLCRVSGPTLTPARYTGAVMLDKVMAYGSLAWRACM